MLEPPERLGPPEIVIPAPDVSSVPVEFAEPEMRGQLLEIFS